MHPGQVRCFPLTGTKINPEIRATKGKLERAVRASQVQIPLKDPTIFPHQRQYPLRPEVKKKTMPIIDSLRTQGLLTPYIASTTLQS